MEEIVRVSTLRPGDRFRFGYSAICEVAWIEQLPTSDWQLTITMVHPARVETVVFSAVAEVVRCV